MYQEEEIKLSDLTIENDTPNVTILQTVVQIFIICSYMTLFLTVLFGLIKSIIEKSNLNYDTISNQLGGSFTFSLFYQVLILTLIIIAIYSYTINPLPRRHKTIAFVFSYSFVVYNTIYYILNDDCWILVKADYSSSLMMGFVEYISVITGAADWLIIVILVFVLVFKGMDVDD